MGESLFSLSSRLHRAVPVNHKKQDSTSRIANFVEKDFLIKALIFQKSLMLSSVSAKLITSLLKFALLGLLLQFVELG